MTGRRPTRAPTPPRRCIRATTPVYREILCTIGRRRPETGGLLLGPVDRCIVTHFHFDDGADCTGSTYTPDYAALRTLMQGVWLPAGLDMKGFVHSHPPGLNRLSSGDLAYIRRLLAANTDMEVFLAPLVLPESFQFCPIVVERRDPSVGHAAILELI